MFVEEQFIYHQEEDGTWQLEHYNDATIPILDSWDKIDMREFENLLRDNLIDAITKEVS
jgi:hypothetical protein